MSKAQSQRDINLLLANMARSLAAAIQRELAAAEKDGDMCGAGYILTVAGSVPLAEVKRC